MKKGALIVDWLSAQPETKFGDLIYINLFFTTTGKIRDNIATKKFSEKYPDLKSPRTGGLEISFSSKVELAYRRTSHRCVVTSG